MLVPIPEVKDLETYNRYLLKKSEEDHDREHYRYDQSIAERHKEDLKELLLWAGSQPLSSAHAFNTSFSDFLFKNVGKGLDQAELQSILNTNQRFLLWMKAIFPVEFQNIRLNWIVKISEISNGKEVII